MKLCNNIYILELLHNLWNLKREMVQGSERRGNEKDVREEGVKRKRIGKEKGGDRERRRSNKFPSRNI